MKCKEWKTGSSSIFYRGLFEPEDMLGKRTMEQMKKAGIECFEISAPYEHMVEVGFVADPLKIKNIAEAVGMELWSLHLPFSDFLDISTPKKEKQEQIFTIHSELIRSAAKAGFKLVNIHPSAEKQNSHNREERMEASIRYLKRFSDLCEETGLIGTVENLPRSCLGHDIKEMEHILYECPKLKITFDTNHLLSENGDDNVSFVRKLGKKIASLHLSDYDITTERHWVPLDGDNDWKGIISGLEEAGYCGPFLYETIWNKRRFEDDPDVTPQMLKERHMRIASLTE